MNLAAASTTLVRRGGPPPAVFIAFLIVWLSLGLGESLFFRFSRNAPLKRRLWPAFNVADGTLFGAFVFYLQGREQPRILFVVIPVIILITAFNIWATRFCDACGRKLARRSIFSQTQFCSHCGAKLGR